jgi:hypothetical protein
MKTFTAPKQYRSPMASACEHAENVGKRNKKPFTIREYIAIRDLQAKRAAIFEPHKLQRLRRAGFHKKITVVKTFKKGFHATGIGDIPDTDIETLRMIALSEGYTHYKLNNRQTVNEL